MEPLPSPHSKHPPPQTPLDYSSLSPFFQFLMVCPDFKDERAEEKRGPNREPRPSNPRRRDLNVQRTPPTDP